MQELIDLAEIHESLRSKFEPHLGQIPIGKAILYDNCKKVMAQCGRSFGKSYLNSYLHVRIARENAGATNYIFLPFLTQAREVYWQTRLLHRMIDEEDIESINNTEMRITFKNGSMIKLCGADNVDSYRGVKPNQGSIITFDELQNLKQEFIDAFLPNLSVNDPILFVVGTPPSFEGVFTQFADLAQNSPDWKYFHAPTSTNPHVSKQFIEDERLRLTRMGEEETFIREYEAIFIKGGKKSILPMAIKQEYLSFESVKPKDINKWRIMVAFDPSSTGVFGAVFILHNDYSKKSIVFDELYVSEPSEMTARKIFEATQEKLKPYKDVVRAIDFVYDEAAAWYRNELNEVKECDWWLAPTKKAQLGIDGYIDLARTVFLMDLIIVTKECKSLIWEIERFEKDDRGRVPDKDDHNIQSMFYGLQALGLNLDSLKEPKPIDKQERRGYALSSEFQENDYKELD